MCGITGAVWTEPAKAIDEATLHEMASVLRHRGPDDEGFHCQSLSHSAGRCGPVHVALGFRRLSIIDLEGGHQPMSNEDGTVWVVANGEIYNYRDLRRRLEGAGHSFRTACDVETLVHLYEDEGDGFVEHLVGMFAIAIWDARKRRLILARDRLGQKPLAYCHESGRIAFASELKSILAIPGIKKELDPNSLDSYLALQYVPHPQTIFRGIRKLPPGHIAVYENDQLAVKPYWSPRFEQEVDLPRDEYVERVRQTLTESVRLRLQSDVPLGAFLSGGIDSALVAGLAQRESGRQLKTFTIAFGDPRYDESKAAWETANRLGTDHQEFRVEPNAVDILPRLVWHFDEPFGDSSAIPTWYIAQYAREDVTVALSGDGGDELFLGYPRYRATMLAGWADQAPSSLRSLASAFVRLVPFEGRHQKSKLRQLRRLLEVLDQSPAKRYLEWVAIFNEARRGELYEESFVRSLESHDPGRFVTDLLQRGTSRDMATRASLTDLATYLPCDLMTKVDIATMSHGLECRQPLLDHRLVELAVSMPAKLKFRWPRGKRILAKAFPELLPKTVMRRPKMGFGVPLEQWFRRELRAYARDILLDKKTVERGIFRRQTIESLIDEHESGRFNHGYRLWSLLVLELWFRQWADQ